MLTYSTDKSLKNTESRRMTKMAQKVKTLLGKGFNQRHAIYTASTAFGVSELEVIKAMKINIWMF